MTDNRKMLFAWERLSGFSDLVKERDDVLHRRRQVGQCPGLLALNTCGLLPDLLNVCIENIAPYWVVPPGKRILKCKAPPSIDVIVGLAEILRKARAGETTGAEVFAVINSIHDPVAWYVVVALSGSKETSN